MAVKYNSKSGKSEITATGHISNEQSMKLMEAIRKSFEDGNTTIVLNLAGVEFMDSSALGIIVFNKKIAVGKGGDLFVSGTNLYISELFENTKLNKVITILEKEGD
ncbi:MAG: STAS domain-containing protein [Fibrobacterota bacterium]